MSNRRSPARRLGVDLGDVPPIRREDQAELTEALKVGDADARDAAVLSVLPLVASYARDDDEAQAVAALLLERAPSFDDGIASLTTWAHSTARSAVLDARRNAPPIHIPGSAWKARNRVARGSTSPSDLQFAALVERVISSRRDDRPSDVGTRDLGRDAVDARDLIEWGLERINRRWADAIRLYFGLDGEHPTSAEVAERLGISVGLLHQHITLGKNALRRLLASKVGENFRETC